MKNVSCVMGLSAALAVQQAAADGLEELDWLTGHWVSPDGAAEEVWLAPHGGTMTGTFRWVFPNGRVVLEFLVIQEVGGQVWFRWKHYNADYEPWEKGAPNTYLLAEADDSSATFERTGENDKVPLRYRYTREGDTLTFRGEGEAGEEPLVLNFRLRTTD